MIKIDKNYSVVINSTHGFELNYESDPVEKEVKGELKTTTSKDTWYYPKLSQVLNKYYVLSMKDWGKETVLPHIINIENNIENFSKVFAKNGNVLNLK